MLVDQLMKLYSETDMRFSHILVLFSTTSSCCFGNWLPNQAKVEFSTGIENISYCLVGYSIRQIFDIISFIVTSDHFSCMSWTV